MSMIYALDPGPVSSALVVLDGSRIADTQILPNQEMLGWLCAVYAERDEHLVVEQIRSYGMAVGAEVFDTCFWSGRFVEAWGWHWSLMPRLSVKMALCHDSRAKDANIRAALIDRYGGKAATKKGGALYGIKADLWAALAVGVTYQEQQAQRKVS